MKTIVVPTDAYYHAVIAAPDLAEKQARYRQHFVEPLRGLFQALGGMFNADPNDDFAVPRAWTWLLPEALTETPDVLQKLEAADAWGVAREALAEAGARFEPYDARIGIDTIEAWLVLADAARANPYEDGYTGAIDFFAPRLFAQYAVPSARNLERLPGLVAHEMHHVVRLKCFPWDMANTSVTDYIVHEGLAESFANELFGERTVWERITGVDADTFDTARRVMAAGLERTGFDVIRGYIFGDEIAARMHFDAVGMPLYGGYIIGYHVVQAYLARTGKSVVEATFEDARTIVAESGFFR